MRTNQLHIIIIHVGVAKVAELAVRRRGHQAKRIETLIPLSLSPIALMLLIMGIYNSNAPGSAAG